MREHKVDLEREPSQNTKQSTLRRRYWNLEYSIGKCKNFYQFYFKNLQINLTINIISVT